MRVAVGESGSEILIEVQDDGAGFDPASASQGFGLAGMRERVSLAAGTLEIESGERGTLIVARLPARRSEQQGERVLRGDSAEQAAS